MLSRQLPQENLLVATARCYDLLGGVENDLEEGRLQEDGTSQLRRVNGDGR